jgi:hypothetical protein
MQAEQTGKAYRFLKKCTDADDRVQEPNLGGGRGDEFDFLLRQLLGFANRICASGADVLLPLRTLLLRTLQLGLIARSKHEMRKPDTHMRNYTNIFATACTAFTTQQKQKTYSDRGEFGFEFDLALGQTQNLKKTDSITKN